MNIWDFLVIQSREMGEMVVGGGGGCGGGGSNNGREVRTDWWCMTMSPPGRDYARM